MNFGYQDAFNIALVLVGALGSYLLNSVKESVRALQTADANLQNADIALTGKVQAVELLVAGQYVRRDDLERVMSGHREDLNRVMAHFGTQLDRIETKLDGKVDK